VTLFVDGESPMGEGMFTIEVRPRAGVAGQFCELGSTETEWLFRRDLNDAETVAVIEIRKEDGCCDCVPKKWRDEVLFWRDHPEASSGRSLDHLAFVGPVVSVKDDPSSESIQIVVGTRARKPFGNKLVAAVPHFYSEEELDDLGVVIQADTRVDAMTLFLELWADAESQEPSGLTLQPATPALTGVLVTADIPVGAQLGPELQRVMDLAVDVAIVGNVMHVGSLDISADNFDTLTPDVDWETADASILDDGELLVTAVTVNGRDGVTATYPTDVTLWDHPEFGIHHEVIDVNTIETVDEAAAFAASYYALHSPAAGIYVDTEEQSGSVSCDWPVPMSGMVPGRIFSFDTHEATDLYCFNLAVTTRLESMTVTGSGSFEDTVKVLLVPIGTTT